MASDTQSTSTLAVLTSLVANLVLCSIFVLCFLLLRLKFKRIYSPKSSFDLVPEEKRPEPLPKDPFRWVYILLTKPHSFIIQHCGIDGYFYLRYIFVMGLVFLFGMLSWIILLPVNATNGNGHPGLDQLSFANVKHKRRYYAHAFISWIFYGSVIYVIYRELFFFNSFRTAMLSLPRYALKLLLRVLLFQGVPDEMLDLKQFFKLFNGVRRIYVSRHVRQLNKKAARREGLAMRLEEATTKYLVSAVKKRQKLAKKGEDRGSDIDAYAKRPRHRPGTFKRKVDTIDYCRDQLAKLDMEVSELQHHYNKFHRKNALFVEFDDQYTAQLAYQAVTNHLPMRMLPVFSGLEPGDVLWSNLRIFWWEAGARSAIAVVAICALVVLWAIPVAFVGVISNINNLTNKLHWLRWIQRLPHWLLGVVTGLLPTILLNLLMMMLPMFIRGMGTVAGCVSVQGVEMFAQQLYFAFLMVNSFLVTALASSAAAAVTAIIDKPFSALSILALNLPRSLNFFISYLILQGLLIAGGSLFQVVTLFLYYILGRLFDRTLRKKWGRFTGLGSLAWGTTFPTITSLACITLVYSIIAPLILIFAAAAFGLIFITYSYNMAYVLVEGPDSRGAHYPRALFQTFTGIYLGQICLLGLFAVGKGWGPIVLQAIGLGSTVFCHVSLNSAFDHLLKVTPIDCMKPLDGVSQTASFKGQSDYNQRVPRKKREREMENMDIDKEDDVALIADRDYKTTQNHNAFVRYFRPDVYLNYRNTKSMIPSSYYVESPFDDNPYAYNEPDISSKMPKLWIPRDPYGWSAEQIKQNQGVVEMVDSNSEFGKKGIMYVGKAPI